MNFLLEFLSRNNFTVEYDEEKSFLKVVKPITRSILTYVIHMLKRVGQNLFGNIIECWWQPDWFVSYKYKNKK